MSTLDELVVADPDPTHGEPMGYGDWRFVVEIAVPVTLAVVAQWDQMKWDSFKWSTGAWIWDTSKWDQDAWSSGLEWCDLSDRHRGVEWTRGRKGLAGRPETGTAALDLANSDAALSWWNTNSTFPSRRYLSPGSVVRFGYWDPVATIWEPAFTGLVESIDEHASTLDADLWATFTLTETTSYLATVNRLEQATQGAGEFSDQRMDRLLADAAWPFGTDLGGWYSPFHTATLQGTNLSANRLGEVYLTADSVVWDAFSGRDGRLRTWAKDFTDFWQLDDGAHVAVGEAEEEHLIFAQVHAIVPWTEAPALVTNSDDLINEVTAGNAGGTAVTDRSDESQALYGPFGTQRTDLILQDDGLLDDWIGFVLAINALRAHKLSTIKLDAALGARTPEVLVSLDLGLFLYVVRRWIAHPSFPQLWFRTKVVGYTARLAPLAPGIVAWSADLDVVVDIYREITLSPLP